MVWGKTSEIRINMELVSLLNKYLGEAPFIELLPEFLFRGPGPYNLSFYRDVVDQHRIPASDYEHMDKKLKRLTKLVTAITKDIRELEGLIAKYDGVGNPEVDLNFAKGVFSRFQKAQRTYPHYLGIQVADWKSLASSRALRQEVVATYLVEGHKTERTAKVASRPTMPLGYGVPHIAINVRPQGCDLFYYSSCKPLPRVGSGAAHKVVFNKGRLREISSSPTFLS